MKAPDLTSAERFTLSLLSFGGPDAFYAHQWTPDLFPSYPIIFGAIRDAINAGEPYDAISIGHRLRLSKVADDVVRDTTAFLMDAGIAQPHAVQMYFDDLSAAASYRRFESEMAAALPEVRARTADLPAVVEALSRAADTRERAPEATLKSQVGTLIEQLEQRTPPERFASGITNLDNALGGGIERKEMLVSAGPTSSGKSVILGQFALSACIAGKAVAFYSLEMPATTVISRLASNHGNVRVRPMSEIPAPTAGEVAAMSRVLPQILAFKLTVRDRLHALDDILGDARRLIRSGKADMVIVDYIQRIAHNGDTREQAVSECAQKLKTLAMECNVAVVTASQLNDDGRLRESRAIGMDADHIISILGQKSEELELSKYRRGERYQKFPVHLRGALSRFEARKVGR